MLEEVEVEVKMVLVLVQVEDQEEVEQGQHQVLLEEEQPILEEEVVEVDILEEI
jgi:hypothetical protein